MKKNLHDKFNIKVNIKKDIYIFPFTPNIESVHNFDIFYDEGVEITKFSKLNYHIDLVQPYDTIGITKINFK